MDKLEQYRNAIKKILTEYYEISNPQNVENGEIEASERLAFDEKRDQMQFKNLYLRLKQKINTLQEAKQK
jgi:hypothetical protein